MPKPKVDQVLPFEQQMSVRLVAAAERWIDVQERRLERDLVNDRAIASGLEHLAQLLLEKLFEPRHK